MRRPLGLVALAIGLLTQLSCGEPHVIVQAKGSDTMVNLVQRLSEAYLTVNTKVVVSVTGGGSGTGIKSLIDGTTDLATASRPITEKERALAGKNGVVPVEHVVALDGLAVYVHKDNPLPKLDFEQLRCIYGATGTCNHWSDLGLKVDCGGGDDEIIKIGRQNNSGTYEYFRDHIIGKQGKFTSTMDQSGTQQVVDIIGTSLCAIGYGGMGYETTSARFVCMAKEATDTCVEPTISSVQSGVYGFARPLYMYTTETPSAETTKFLDYVLSPVGQKIILNSGFVPKP